MTMRFQFRQQQYILKTNRNFLMFCIFFFSLFCLLGIWQLHRYEFKKTLMLRYHQHVNATPVPFNLLSSSEKNIQFQAVSVQGEFLNEYTILLQNRMHQQQMGFEVLTPLRIAGEEKLLLVNRGWVQELPSHASPTIPLVSGQQNVIGYIKFLDEYQFILGNNILDSSQKPLLIQKIDLNDLTKITQQSYFPFVLRLAPSAANGFIRDWVISAGIPERHFMYALQWFVMAGILIIAYFGFCIERVKSL